VSESDETIVSLFEASAARNAERPALRFKRAGAWETVSWREWSRRVRALASELVARGVERGDRVAIFGNTREEWVTADVASLLAGAVVVPIYQTLIGEQAAYILEDSGAKVLFCEDGSVITRVLDVTPARIDALAAIVTFDDARLSALPDRVRAKTLSWRTLMTRADTRDQAETDRIAPRAAEVRPGDLATILYTSGTTGDPKGVMLTHANFVYETAVLMDAFQITNEDDQLLFLPLAHVFAKILAIGMVRAGGTLTFAESLMKAIDNAAETNPTFMACVPRLYEKMCAVAIEKAAQQGTIKNKVFAWATSVGAECARLEERGRRVEGALAVQRRYADKLVLRQIRNRFGTRLRFAISGGAPLARELAEWFWGCGVKVLEGYGLTETTAPTNANTLQAYRFGSVGRALPGTEVRIAADGEVLMRGPNLMTGYWRREAETREVMDADGWFHSGDIGVIDAGGYLTITDRKKDMLLTAGGKNVAPQNIESRLKQSPWISHAALFGDRRPYLVALITLDPEAMMRFAEETGREPNLATLARDPEVHARVALEVEATNRRLSQFEQVKRFTILPTELTQEGGELTPTLKVRRRTMAEKYAKELDALYE
jgi:long-chain acyl-CoA synthetase